MKRYLLYSLPLLIVIIYVLSKTDLIPDPDQTQALHPDMESVESYIEQGQLDSAYTLLQIIIDDTLNRAEYDSAISLQLQIQKIILLDVADRHTNALLELSTAEYDQLQNNQLDKALLSHPLLNRYYIQRLRSKLQHDQDTGPDPQFRFNYVQELRKTYIDLGFEVDIYVSGEKNENLTISSPVFDEQWFEKFEQGGDLDAWHAIGFNRIQIMNGDDFIRIKEWPQ